MDSKLDCVLVSISPARRATASSAASKVLLAGAILAFQLSLAQAAGLSRSQKCEIAKDSAAGKRALCATEQRHKEIVGKPFDYAMCTTKMADAFTSAEKKAKGECATIGDAPAVEVRIDAVFDPSSAIPKSLAGVRFVDNGDGTVTDTQAGLMWEKKDNSDGDANYDDPHDVDNLYSWSAPVAPYESPGGTAFTDFLYKLNNCTFSSTDLYTQIGGFAGHCDWRLPTLAELETIVDGSAPGCCVGFPCSTYAPCIDPAFGPTAVCTTTCGYIGDEVYWTTTNDLYYQTSAVCIDFSYFPSDYPLDQVSESSQGKANSYRVRAVRGTL